MSDKAFHHILKTVFPLAILLGGGLWYSTVGRKPKITLSVPVADKLGTAGLHAVGPSVAQASGLPPTADKPEACATLLHADALTMPS